MKKLTAMLFGLAVMAMSVPCFAHFQMIYTPEAAMNKGGKIPVVLVFTHPFEAGHTMDMGKPEQFFAVRSRGENEPKKNRSSQHPETDHLAKSDQLGQGLGHGIYCQGRGSCLLFDPGTLLGSK